MQVGVIQPGQNVVVVDDLVATGGYHICAPKEILLSPHCLGGSAAATGELIAKQGGKAIEYLFIVELTFLNPQSKLDAPIYSMIQIDQD